MTEFISIKKHSENIILKAILVPAVVSSLQIVIYQNVLNKNAHLTPLAFSRLFPPIGSDWQLHRPITMTWISTDQSKSQGQETGVSCFINKTDNIV